MHPIIAKSIVAVARKDPKMIKEAVEEICDELQIDNELGSTFAEITLDSYNPDKFGIRESILNILTSSIFYFW